MGYLLVPMDEPVLRQALTDVFGRIHTFELFSQCFRPLLPTRNTSLKISFDTFLVVPHANFLTRSVVKFLVLQHNSPISNNPDQYLIPLYDFYKGQRLGSKFFPLANQIERNVLLC